VAHHLGAGAGLFARADGTLERLQPVLGNYILRHAHLRAQHHIAVLRNGARRAVGLRKINVIQLGNGKPSQSNIGDMHEGIKPGSCLSRDEAAESGEVVGTGVARRNTGGGALMRNELVGRNTDGRAVGIDMGVEVDEPRRDQLTSGIEHLPRACNRNIRFESLDHPKADADVAFSAQALAGVEHIAALDHQVEFIIGPHCGVSSRHASGKQREWSSGGEKLAARSGHDFPPVRVFKFLRACAGELGASIGRTRG
jgi:hypothetical protein